ncbi:hypothetical protein B0I35DRAFT_413516 [Stachybotrys elegans]|uniref:Core domain-containing protein n=1 Tax=Stachybotrys elegans TaxID=80388 RepID=A0A8K0SCG1_9HYPO|nr:hypothetical protein B0I35DRAFT_413516 [Stachybotrys elegans]
MAPPRCTNPASATRSFVQIVSRNYSALQSSTQLDFLLPRCFSTTTMRRRCVYSRFHPTETITASHAPLKPSASRLARTFTTSAPRNATVCARNPLKDEDGKDMILEITPRAAKRLTQIMAKDENPNLALRIQVESGGCHGFQYLMSLVTLPAKDAQEGSTTINEDDSIFQYVADDSDAALPHTPQIILDEPSLELLKGSKVDFTMELIGSEFKIVDNPHASSSCGCGTSFDIKM